MPRSTRGHPLWISEKKAKAYKIEKEYPQLGDYIVYR